MNKSQLFIPWRLFFAVLIVAMTMANAQSANSMVGVWNGSMQADNFKIIPIELSVTQDNSAGKPAGQLTYGRPWDCTFNLQYSGALKSIQVFTLSVGLVGASGPVCKKFIDSQLQLTPKAGGLLDVSINKDGKTLLPNTELQLEPSLQ